MVRVLLVTIVEVVEPRDDDPDRGRRARAREAAQCCRSGRRDCRAGRRGSGQLATRASVRRGRPRREPGGRAIRAAERPPPHHGASPRRVAPRRPREKARRRQPRRRAATRLRPRSSAVSSDERAKSRTMPQPTPSLRTTSRQAEGLRFNLRTLDGFLSSAATSTPGGAGFRRRSCGRKSRRPR
jgi:hypothetical protein